MKKHYLIDYENMRENAFPLISSAGPDDIIYIIYTANASRINLDALSDVNSQLKIIKASAGKQSLDMHLVSYLGYLLFGNGREDQYYIVSKDKGYDAVISFWKKQGFSSVSRIEPEAKPAGNAPSEAEKAAASETAVIPENNGTGETNKPSESAPQKRRNRSRRSPRAAKAPAMPASGTNTAAAVTEPASEAPASEAPASEKAAINTVPEKKAAAKNEPVSENEADPLTTDRSMLNTLISRELAKYEMPNATRGKITSIAMKNSKGGKRAVYLEIIKMYGKKNGLTFYNYIKPVLK